MTQKEKYEQIKKSKKSNIIKNVKA